MQEPGDAEGAASASAAPSAPPPPVSLPAETAAILATVGFDPSAFPQAFWICFCDGLSAPVFPFTSHPFFLPSCFFYLAPFPLVAFFSFFLFFPRLRCSWYHGLISRHVAETLLMHNGSDGTYLLRDNSAKDGFLLSVRTVDAVAHFKVWSVVLLVTA